MVTLPQHPEANQALGEVAAELDVRGVNAAAYMPATGAGAATPIGWRRWGRRSRWIRRWRERTSSGTWRWRLPRRWSWLRHGFPVTPAAIAEGIRQTRWPGRLERIERDGVEWILDVAHNPAGAWALRAGLRGLLRRAGAAVLVFSCLRDKPVAEMAQILFPLV